MKNEEERIKEIKHLIRKNVKWGDPDYRGPGGQSVTKPSQAVLLISDEIDFRVEIGFSRSQLKNKEVAYALFELALDEFIK